MNLLAAAAPRPLRLTDTIRSYEQQARLRQRKGEVAAPAGKSLHETGLAVDVEGVGWDADSWLDANKARFGLRGPPGKHEPWHLEKIPQKTP